jgi:hypothetical protein
VHYIRLLESCISVVTKVLTHFSLTLGIASAALASATLPADNSAPERCYRLAGDYITKKFEAFDVISITELWATEASRQAILKAIARARQWYEQITAGKARDIAQLAAIDGVSPRLIRMQMKLVQLSPQSIEKVTTHPNSLPLSLNDLLAAIPLDWCEQAFGVSKKST